MINFRRVRKRGPLAVLVVVVYLALTRGLYFFPVSIALGPCMLDWTNPGTYIGLFRAPASPMQKVRFSTGSAHVQICYGQPSARGRTVFTPDSLYASVPDSILAESPDHAYGTVPDSSLRTSVAPVRVLVPDGNLWRMGANEPTRIFLDGPVMLGDVALKKGRYALYTIPGPQEWEIFVTRSTFHWGNQITKSVRSKEVGSFHATVVRSTSHEDRLLFYPTPGVENTDHIVLAWSDRKVIIPIQALQ